MGQPAEFGTQNRYGNRLATDVVGVYEMARASSDRPRVWRAAVTVDAVVNMRVGFRFGTNAQVEEIVNIAAAGILYRDLPGAMCSVVWYLDAGGTASLCIATIAPYDGLPL